jgi:hypothetical protein
MSDRQLRFDGPPETGRSCSRDPEREHKFLLEAARGDEVFVAHAERRLAVGEREYGSSWAWVGIRHLLNETIEESVDLAAWSALCDQALDHAHDLSELHVEQLRAVLAVVARRGAEAHSALANALRSVERTA